ncbi:hypothetical protein [Konateibacter massiliensis]|nr:hypothetical protein [Konateibacter massiliensis]
MIKIREQTQVVKIILKINLNYLTNKYRYIKMITIKRTKVRSGGRQHDRG